MDKRRQIGKIEPEALKGMGKQRRGSARLERVSGR